MKKFWVLVALLAASATPSLAQASKLIDYFSDNAGPNGEPDQQVRLVNFGLAGTPLTSPVGDVCANIYVFDANQELVACCSCRITPNGLRTISIGNNLTMNPVTSVVPVDGVIEIVSTLAGTGACSPLTYNSGLLDSTVAWTYTQQKRADGSGGGNVTAKYDLERKALKVTLSVVDADFLLRGCQYARYLGSGKGVCTCGTGS